MGHTSEFVPVAPSASNLLTPPRDAVRVDTGRGAILYWELAPRVYMTEVRGFMTQPMSQLIMKQAEPLYAIGGKVHGIHNWFGMENYDSVCRVELTSWVLSHRAQTGLHIGLRSRMVAMGVAVANLALGSLIQVHNEPRALEEALSSLLRRGP